MSRDPRGSSSIGRVALIENHKEYLLNADEVYAHALETRQWLNPHTGLPLPSHVIENVVNQCCPNIYVSYVSRTHNIHKNSTIGRIILDFLIETSSSIYDDVVHLDAESNSTASLYTLGVNLPAYLTSIDHFMLTRGRFPSNIDQMNAHRELFNYLAQQGHLTPNEQLIYNELYEIVIEPQYQPVVYEYEHYEYEQPGFYEYEELIVEEPVVPVAPIAPVVQPRPVPVPAPRAAAPVTRPARARAPVPAVAPRTTVAPAPPIQQVTQQRPVSRTVTRPAAAPIPPAQQRSVAAPRVVRQTRAPPVPAPVVPPVQRGVPTTVTRQPGVPNVRRVVHQAPPQIIEDVYQQDIITQPIYETDYYTEPAEFVQENFVPEEVVVEELPAAAPPVTVVEEQPAPAQPITVARPVRGRQRG